MDQCRNLLDTDSYNLYDILQILKLYGGTYEYLDDTVDFILYSKLHNYVVPHIQEKRTAGKSAWLAPGPHIAASLRFFSLYSNGYQLEGNDSE